MNGKYLRDSLPRRWPGVARNDRAAEKGAKNPTAQNTRRPRSLGKKQVLREGPLLVDPLRIEAEAGALGHFSDFFGLVLVGAFGPNRFVLVQDHPQVGHGNAHALPARRAQMHFDAPVRVIPARLVAKAAQVKIGTELAV